VLTAAETALKEDKFIRGALPSAANSRLEFLVIGPSAAVASASAAVAVSVDSAKKNCQVILFNHYNFPSFFS
jgi:hypothetical protein